jgi:hypothetical protein
MSTDKTEPTIEDVQVLLDLMFPTSGQCLGIAAELKVADLLADGPRGIAELAKETGAHQHALRSTLSILSEDGIFAEVEPGVFANTPRSQLLRQGVPNSQFIMSQFAASEWLWTCYAKTGYSVKTGKAAFEEAYGKSLWAYMGQNPDKGREFNMAMNEFSQTLGPSIVAGYPDFGKAEVIADLGGGTGTYLANILNSYPSVRRGVLADLPPVIEQAKARPDLAGLIEAGRLDFQAGDFFETVPAGVDLYVCKQITHSWNDEKLLSVLKRCRDASPTASIAAAELVLRPGVQKFVKYFDVMMLVTMAGFLRTEEQYAEVFKQAGYELTRVVPTETAFSIIEAVPAD